MVVRCCWGMALQVSMVAWCDQGISLQVVKRNGTVASRWCWVADGDAVLLGNVIRGFHGGAVLLGNSIAGFHGGAVWESHCKWLDAM